MTGLRKIILPETPAAPTDVAAPVVTAGTVELTWDDNGDASRWKVYRDSVLRATVNKSQYKDSVQPGTTYSYEIVASNINDSDPSDALSVSTNANTTPAWNIQNQTGFLGSSYSLNLNTVCSDLDEHSISYSIVSGSVAGLSLIGSTLVGVPSAVSSTNLTLRANDGFGTSDATIGFSVVDLDVTAPSVPGSVTATATGSTVTITWTASTDTNGINRYKVYRDGVFLDNSNALSYEDTGLSNGTYTYSVSAVDNSSNQNESAQGSATPVVVSVVNPTPDIPTNVVATPASSSSISVTWTQGPSGAAPDDYDVQYSSTGSGGSYTTWPHTGTATSTTITGLSAGTYHIRVRANNGANASAFCVPVQAIITPTGTAADFTIAATPAAVVFDGVVAGVQPGDIIELAAGVHGQLTLQNIVGTAQNRITIRGPATGVATIRRANPGNQGFVCGLLNCRHVNFDGISTTATPGADGKRRNIKITYATNATSGNKDLPSAFLRFGNTSTATYTMTRNITIRYIEVEGGYPTLSNLGAAINVNEQTLKVSDYPAGTFQEDIIVEHCLLRNVYGEGMYIGSNTYHAIDGSGRSIPLRYIKVRHNYVTDCGNDGINPKSIFGGTAGGDGATENSIHHNVFLRCGFRINSNGTTGIGVISCKMDVYNNWVENCAGPGIQIYADRGTEVDNAGLTFTSKIYNNIVVNTCVNESNKAGINVNSHNTIPSAMQPVGQIFNNTVVNNVGNGIRIANNANSASWIRNNISLSNGGTNVVTGPGSKSNNLEAGTAGSLLVDATGTFEGGNLNLRLQAESAASGSIGTDIAATDYTDATRSGTTSKGAYEFA